MCVCVCVLNGGDSFLQVQSTFGEPQSQLFRQAQRHPRKWSEDPLEMGVWETGVFLHLLFRSGGLSGGPRLRCLPSSRQWGGLAPTVGEQSSEDSKGLRNVACYPKSHFLAIRTSYSPAPGV